MKKTIFLLALTAGFCFAAEEQDTVQRSFTVNPPTAKLIVDALEGDIIVSGYQGSEIRVTVQERWRGDTNEDVRRTRNEVRLDMTQEGNTVRLYVDGPFRKSNGSRNPEVHYSARFDFDVQVPVQASVDLRAVNASRIAVSNTSGAYSVRNVNGAIDLKQIGGSGAANTVNGNVTVAFQSNPKEPCTFKSVNGEIDAAFQPGLSAELSVRTVRGEAWTDLASTALVPAQTSAGDRQGARPNIGVRGTRLRAGSGGPQLNFETVNGSIQIKGKGE